MKQISEYLVQAPKVHTMQLDEYLLSKQKPNANVEIFVNWKTKYKDFINELKHTNAKEVNFKEDLQNIGDYVTEKKPYGYDEWDYATLRTTIKTGEDSYVKFIFIYKDRMLVDFSYAEDSSHREISYYPGEEDTLDKINELLAVINLKIAWNDN